MRTTISVLWFVFTLLFLHLGLQHWAESSRSIPNFPMPEREELRKVGSIQIMGQDLDKPIKDFATNFNAYLANQNKSNRAANRRSAWGYFFAAFAAFVSMLLEWRDPICRRFKGKNQKPIEAGQPTDGQVFSESAPSASSEKPSS